jgi:transposase
MDADPRDQIIEELKAKNKALQAENEELRRTIKKLQDRLEELERQANRQAAPFRRPDKKRKPRDQRRKPGRKKGHPPAYRQVPGHVDEHIEVPLHRCPNCDRPVTNVQPCEQYIEDIPPTRPHVTRLVTYTGTCPTCGDVRSTHPKQVSTAVGAAQTHLGPRASGLAAWLKNHLGLTFSRTAGVLEKLCGLKVTRGGLAQALHRVADKSEGWFNELSAQLRLSSVAYVDETSWWLDGSGCWLWTFVTPNLTLYRVDASRGKDVVLDTLGTRFGGVLVSDCLASYENLPYTMHKYYAHHLKAITQARDRKPLDARGYLEQLRGLLHAAMTLDRLRTDLPPPVFAQARRGLDDQANALLIPTRRDPDEERVANRLRKRRHWLFTFLDYPGVEATNNRAERGLRPAVIARKLSCGNKTERGKRTWEILTSLAATCHQRAQDFVDRLRPCLALDASSPAR